MGKIALYLLLALNIVMLAACATEPLIIQSDTLATATPHQKVNPFKSGTGHHSCAAY